MSYREKLKGFNDTQKYKDEMAYLIDKIDPHSHEVILDYGCGLGVMVEQIISMGVQRIHGYDILQHNNERPMWFRDNIYFYCHKIYFMHSIAHLADPFKVLVKLREKALAVDGEIHILTPNQAWMDKLNNPDYIPDPTVNEHYTSNTLLDLLLESGYKIDEVECQGQKIGNECERLYAKARS